MRFRKPMGSAAVLPATLLATALAMALSVGLLGCGPSAPVDQPITAPVHAETPVLSKAPLRDEALAKTAAPVPPEASVQTAAPVPAEAPAQTAASLPAVAPVQTARTPAQTRVPLPTETPVQVAEPTRAEPPHKSATPVAVAGGSASRSDSSQSDAADLEPVPLNPSGISMQPGGGLTKQGGPEPPPGQEPRLESKDGSEVGGEADAPVQGPVYQWMDGDRTLTAQLQTDLVATVGGEDEPVEIIAATGASGETSLRSADARGSDALPVFRSLSGNLMTLPGGVVLMLNPEWGARETKAFFARNRIEPARVSELGLINNGFLVDTDPGFPSLDLANQLAGQDGVEVSSPNWWTEATLR